MYFDGPFENIVTAESIIMALLIVLVICSAFGVIHAKHQGRLVTAKLEQLQQERDSLSVRWTQLLLEKATWASDLRVERVAREQLNMILPDAIYVIDP